MRRHSITNRYRTRVRPRVLSQTIVCVTHTNGLRFHSFQCPACPSIFCRAERGIYTRFSASLLHISGPATGGPITGPRQLFAPTGTSRATGFRLTVNPWILGPGVTTNPERQKWARKQQRTPCCHPFYGATVQHKFSPHLGRFFTSSA